MNNNTRCLFGKTTCSTDVLDFQNHANFVQTRKFLIIVIPQKVITSDNKIATVHGSLPYPLVSLASLLTDLLDSYHKEEKYLSYLRSLYFSHLHVAMSSVNFHLASSTMWKEQNAEHGMANASLRSNQRILLSLMRFNRIFPEQARKPKFLSWTLLTHSLHPIMEILRKQLILNAAKISSKQIPVLTTIQ